MKDPVTLQPIEQPAHDLRALLELCNARLAAARRADPKFRCAHGPEQMRDGQRLVARFSDLRATYASLALDVLVIGTMVSAIATRGPVLWAFVAASGVAGLVTLAFKRRYAQPVARWHAEAEVVPAVIVQANTALFAPPDPEEGCELSGPGVLLVTFDPGLAADPGRLVALADHLFALKTRGETEMNAEERALRVFLGEELEWRNGMRRKPIPLSVAGAPRTYLVEVWFLRDAMPHGLLHRRVWLAMGRDRDESVQLAPLELWWHIHHDEVLAWAAEDAEDAEDDGDDGDDGAWEDELLEEGGQRAAGTGS